MVKKYIVDLSVEERTQLERFTTTGRHESVRSENPQLKLLENRAGTIDL
jgi:hypothetical protein